MEITHKFVLNVLEDIVYQLLENVKLMYHALPLLHAQYVRKVTS